MRKLISILFVTVLAILISGFIHEDFHLLSAQLLGYNGRIQFDSFTQFVFYYDLPYPTGWKDFVIGLSGGIGTGILFLLFWFFALKEKTIDRINYGIPFLALGIGQIVYTPFDAISYHLTLLGTVIGLIFGVSMSIFYYRKLIKQYLIQEN